MTPDERIIAVQNILASLFASQRALKALAPDYGWQGLGNLLGDYGEFIATTKFGLTKAGSGSDGFDAVTDDGRKVQVKTSYAAKQIGFRGTADLLLVLKIQSDGLWEQLYFGPFEPVLAASRHSARDNKQTLSLSKLLALAVVHSMPSTPTHSIA